ncbi:SprT family metallopeptidase, putative [Talaromyces stipitatus ATCC 10500]|uniref:SprT family metallopeptidase, putative n=1 Tax=Talaromyces stipitatus (strain ATCC 10500 / CBS 375.48 / QM 6759 / NRRL 1006) TaxID=441959 RepID=B8MDC2_TALSN|nr:SprT family metallopeptidase, putative [Talaromyces stipitatus ATCC 10500]EED17647.1 SprT family metallopeptidase, putative [Talaromyces stipitatus ATCC 10500]
MARLNTSNPTVVRHGRPSPSPAKPASPSSSFTRTTTWSPLKPRSKQQTKKNNGVSEFKIFEDEEQSDNDEERSADPFIEPQHANKKKPMAPLKLTHTNSITSGLSKRASQDSSGSSSRRSRFGSDSEEEESSDKENLFFDNEAEEDPDDSEEEGDDEEEDGGEDTGLHEDANSGAGNGVGSGRRFDSEPPEASFMQYRETRRKEESDESEVEVSDDSDGYNSLDDFIVSDNEDLSYFDDGLEEDEDEEVKPPTPKPSRRRLIRGRKPRTSSISSQTQRLHISNEIHSPASTATPPQKSLHNEQISLHFSSPFTHLLPNEGLDTESEPTKYLKPKRSPLRESINSISSSPGSTRKQQVNKMETPPCSPSKDTRLSPSKMTPRIPPSPHRQSSDAFWSQELTNAWNDQWSPPKPKTKSKALERVLALNDKGSFSTDADSVTMGKASSVDTPAKSLSKTALKKAELAEKKTAAARKKEFNDKKTSLAMNFLLELDMATTGGRVNELAQPTGGIKIEWKKTLRRTAGRATWKVVTIRKPDGRFTFVHHALIELAEHIIDDEFRLLNTMAHEYCHLANNVISGVRHQPHGPSFKEWGRKCVEAMKQHPVYKRYPIEVTTHHTYEIDYKYRWICTDCGYQYGRHSKSIDPSRVRCGHCKGPLLQTQPKPRNASAKKNTPVSNTEINQNGVLGEENFDNMLESLGSAHLG